MDKTAILVCCVLLCIGVATAFPGSSLRRAAGEPSANPDREVEAVEPVRRGGGGAAEAEGREPVRPGDSDESPELVPFGIGLGGLGFGGRPILAIRPIPEGRDSAEASDEEADYGGGYLNPYFVDPMSSFMAQMAEMMAAMRRQMSQVLDRLPAEGADISKLGNTTSTTKVVDGHVITVNETVIGGEDGDDSVVHIRVIDVHPSESPESAETDSDDKDNNKGKSPAGQDTDKDAEPLGADGSDEVTSAPNRSDNEIPMKVGSEVDDLNA